MKVIVNDITYIVSEDILDKVLSQWLREDLHLTGTKIGCGIGVCGTCTVLIDGLAFRSCKLKVSDVLDKSVTTIEGIAGKDGTLHPLQKTFIDCGAIQCGFCTPGMVLTALAFLNKNPNPTRQQIRQAIRPVLCRCTGYQQIIDAIQSYAQSQN